MTKQQLITELAKRLELSRAKAAKAVDALFGARGIVPEELRKGRRVQISGFGQFETKTRAARTGRDPRNGKSITIATATSPVFRPGQPLRDSVRKALAGHAAKREK